MKLYNTLTRRKEDFEPITPGIVNMYVCGPTVYDYIHIGNARPFVIFDTVRRYLEYKGFKVNFVRNFTDVDDKIIKRGNDIGEDAKSVADRFIREFYVDAQGLCLAPAMVSPRVTEEMPEIIDMIGTLIEKGFAYEINGTVYFDTAKFPEYGKLSGKKIDELLSGARVAVEEQKRLPTDFVLWKPAKEGEPAWSSPWGMGRPGWHIECSVMAKKYLGDTLDIHAGGEDLIFPHHENEIAQSECANGKIFAKYWLHNGMILINEKKMAKSEGNFFTVREIAEKYHYDVIRFFILSGNYRMPLNFSADQLNAAAIGLKRVRVAVAELTLIAENSAQKPLTQNEKMLADKADDIRRAFESAMDDDFSTANAITAILDYTAFVNANVITKRPQSPALAALLLQGLKSLSDVLGIKASVEPDDETLQGIMDIVKKREAAREAKDYAESDLLREKLIERGCIVKDTREGMKWLFTGRL